MSLKISKTTLCTFKKQNQQIIHIFDQLMMWFLAKNAQIKWRKQLLWVIRLYIKQK